MTQLEWRCHCTPWSDSECAEVPLLSSKVKSGVCKKSAILWVTLVLVIVGITLGLVFGLRSTQSAKENGKLGAVVSNCEGCAEVGGKILEEGGSAVDAVIATLLCEGALLPHGMGVGGGFIATIYEKATGKVETLIARETAPAAAREDMFIGKDITGAISTAIPSEIYGYWRLHEKYGKLPWRTLFLPTIEMCRKGLKVSKQLANVLEMYKERIRKEPSMSEIFINPATSQTYREGEIMYRRTLADTLQIIAEEGPQVVYRGGRIGRMLVEDIQSMGGIVTESDLQNYDVRWEVPINTTIRGGYRLYTTPLPTSGAILTFILNIMDGLYTNHEDLYWQRVVETFKHAYGHRTNLGDLYFEPQVNEIYQMLQSREYAAEIRTLIKDNETVENFGFYGGNFTNEEDHGTANLAVLAPNGDAITVTSTINSHLGAKVRSRQTGIILNDEMDDFSTPGIVNAYGIPASPANYIKPGKRPMSSTCPSIVLDKYGDVMLLVGAAGGAKITTAVAQTILRYFALNQSMEEAVNKGRLHHQLAPMYVDIEPDVPDHTVGFLSRVGHDLNYLPVDKAFSALTAIGGKTSEPVPICDHRRFGSEVVVRTNPHNCNPKFQRN